MDRTSVLEALVDEIAEKVASGAKHDASGTPISTGYSHGPGGTFSYPGVDPVAFHTIVGNRGLVGMIPTRARTEVNPTYFTVTGVTAGTGTEKSAVCADAPTAGLMKGCLTTAPFGRYERQSHELELNRLGQKNDRSDPMDLTLVGRPISQTGLFSSGPGEPGMPANVLNNEVSRKFWELSIELHRLMSRQVWRGNPANNTAGGGYKEFLGLAKLINTGYRDAETGAACPAMDPDIRNFTFKRVDGTGNDNLIVEMIASMFYFLDQLAEDTAVTPVNYVIAMRQSLFWELTAVWPCAYLTSRCQVSGNESLNIDANDQITMRDEMRRGKYLLINGNRVPVVIDDGIEELTNTTSASVPSGCFASDIYILPLSVIGGQSVLFLDYFDYNNPDLQAALGMPGIFGQVQGPWLTWPKQKNQCVQWQTKIEPRLVLRTPWLAGRIQNVVYCPAKHERDPFPSDPYFVNGGITTREGPSLYKPVA